LRDEAQITASTSYTSSFRALVEDITFHLGLRTDEFVHAPQFGVHNTRGSSWVVSQIFRLALCRRVLTTKPTAFVARA